MAKKNGRQETLLTQALTEIALEDTRHLKDRMMFDPALDDTAEALHRENRKRISALIQKNLGKKRRQGWMMLPAAACLALLLLGTLKLLKAPEDHTLRPGPTQIALTVLPGGTQTPAPTGTPMSTASPTAAVTPTTTPTPSPAPTPSASPSPAPTPLEDSWPGTFFPAGLPEGFHLIGVFQGDVAGAAHQAQFGNDQAAELILSEFETARVVEPGPGARDVHYLSLPSSATALVWDEDRGGFVVWNQEGRTLMSHATTGSADAIAFAGSIKKIK